MADQAVREALVVVGLGNPGKGYAMTRHNMGFLVVQALASQLGIPLKEEKRFSASAGKGRFGTTTLHLVMPLTFMNDSGSAVRRYLDYYKLTVEDIVVVTDDVAFPFGELRLRALGSAGGHNGLKSIQAHLGTQNYVRLRMGVGDKGMATLSDHVLGGFSSSEREGLAEFLGKGADTVLRLCRNDVDSVMNAVNIRKKVNEKQEEQKQQQKDQQAPTVGQENSHGDNSRKDSD